jgi:hypothetical protein
MQPLNLLLEKPDYSYDLDVIIEEKNAKEDRNVYISGIYLMAESKNRNNRKYQLNEMIDEVVRYKKEFIDSGRSIGELNHPAASAEVDLKNACHMVLSLEQKGNYFYGKSKILSTPSGVIVKSLLNDGVKLGISSRALGRLVPQDDVNLVQGFRLITLDLVHEPSVQSAMMESILENKQYVIDQGGKIVELACDGLECSIKNLPKKDVQKHIQESFINFINSLKG